MKKTDRSEEDYISEIEQLRKRVAELESLDAKWKLLEDELARSETTTQSVLNAIPDLMFQISKDGIFLDYKGAREDLYTSPEQFMGKHINNALPSFLADITIDHVAKALETNDIQIFEYELPIHNQRNVFETRMVPCGKERVLAIVRNITHRKLVEEELHQHREHLEEIVEERTRELAKINEKLHNEIYERKEAEKELLKFKTITDNSNSGVAFTNLEGSILYINEFWADIHGYTPEELLGKNLSIFHNQDQMKDANRINMELKEKGSYSALEVWHSHKDGSVFPMLMNGVIIKDSANKPLYMAAHALDITEWKKLEKEFLRSDKLESLGILAGGIAHDFNNILTAIWNDIYLAKKLLKPGNREFEIMNRIEKASRLARNLTQQLLTFAKGGSPVKKTISTVELLRNSIEFSLRGSIINSDLSVPDDLYTIEADAGQMTQVINNLLINAQQAMPEGGTIQVSAVNLPAGSEPSIPITDRKLVKITVTDFGVGIPKTDLDKIFDPYFTTKPNGSGLGLATAYSIIKNHNGHISVDSEPGVSTTFRIYLPASMKKLKSMIHETEIPKFTRGKILLMDDEEFVRDSTADLLKSVGYTVDLAREGNEAIKKFKISYDSQNPYCAVIMDLTVPGGMGGKETIRHLRSIDPEVFAIVSSGYSNDPVLADHKKYGFDGIVAKPFNLMDLIEVLEKNRGE